MPYPIRSIFLACILTMHISSCKTDKKIDFIPQKGDHIVFIGNTFAERLQYYNYFEPLLYNNFPSLNLTVRNMGWSADEVNLQPRPLNFGTLDKHLTEHKADIIIACFGFNEAFKGPDSLDNFKLQLSGFLQHLKEQKYNGTTQPKLILVSPIAAEKMSEYLPDPAFLNHNLQLYTNAMGKVSQSLDIPFIDLYTPTLELMRRDSDTLTINGIHLNDKGYKLASEEMAKALNLKIASWQASCMYRLNYVPGLRLKSVPLGRQQM